MNELKALALEILDKYHAAECSVIGEFSSRTNADLEALTKEIAEYTRRIIAISE